MKAGVYVKVTGEECDGETGDEWGRRVHMTGKGGNADDRQ